MSATATGATVSTRASCTRPSRQLRRLVEALVGAERRSDRRSDRRARGRPEQRAADAAARYRDSASWLRSASVQGIGIARRVTGGRHWADHTLTVFVDEKRPPDAVRDPVPRRVEIPEFGPAVRTDVVAIGRVALQASALRPVNPGCSISLAGRPSGTLGCLVTRPGTEGVFLLTAGHVLPVRGADDHPVVLQPGSDQGGRLPESRLATVTDRIALTSTATDFPNVADGVIARITDPSDVARRIPGIGVPRGRTDALRIGQTVQLVGQTSGFQTGTVVSLTYAAAFDMELPGGRTARVGFSELVLCTRFTSDGDSGAAVLDDDNHVVGLHLGGSDSASFFCRIGHVCTKLGIELL